MYLSTLVTGSDFCTIGKHIRYTMFCLSKKITWQHGHGNFRKRPIPQTVYMHTGIELDNLQCIAYKPEEKWKASPEFVRLFMMYVDSAEHFYNKIIPTGFGDKT